MGGSSYDDDLHTAARSARAASGISDFKHDDDVRTGKVQRSLHPSLDIRLKKKREAFDSPAHPQSKPICVMFDVTGSMGEIPKILVKKLPLLMGLFLRKGYVSVDPQLMFGCIGDANHDAAPLQCGEFESGIEIDDAFSNMWLEGGGGGNHRESYDLAMYCAARKFHTHAFEKRQEKGYLFIIGDEMYYDYVHKDHVLGYVGDRLESNIPIKEMYEEASKKWEIFYIQPKTNYYWYDKRIETAWKDLLGEHYIRLEEIDAVCETIIATVGLMEGNSSVDNTISDLASAGVVPRISNAVSKGLELLSKTTNMSKFGSGELPERASSPPPGLKKL